MKERLEIGKPVNAKPVVVVNIRPVPFYNWEKVDHTDYTHPRIRTIIPAWKWKDGRISSLLTGKSLVIGENDEIRNVSVGTAFKYPDGRGMLYARRWNGKAFDYFYTNEPYRPNECIVIKAFGE